MIVSVPFAAADETHYDCEESVTYDHDGNPNTPPVTGPQPGIGYNTLAAFWQSWKNDFNSPGGIFVCEGEHWDGQDNVQSDTAPCGGATRLNANDLFIGLCSSQDMANDPGSNPTTPGVRVSSKDQNRAYIGLNVPLVGHAQTYVDRETVAVYVADNTPGNVLATVVSAAGITQGNVGETDCDQSVYQSGATQGNRTLCSRDNTAVTVTHSLLV